MWNSRGWDIDISSTIREHLHESFMHDSSVHNEPSRAGKEADLLMKDVELWLER